MEEKKEEKEEEEEREGGSGGHRLETAGNGSGCGRTHGGASTQLLTDKPAREEHQPLFWHLDSRGLGEVVKEVLRWPSGE